MRAWTRGGELAALSLVAGEGKFLLPPGVAL